MAKDASGSMIYYLLLEEIHQADLASIRQWDNLKAAFDGHRIWVKDFNEIQINAVEVKSIPFKTLFYEQQGKLCLLNSLLPDRNVPSLLWTPIIRALPIKLPPLNHNYFGVAEKIPMQLIPSEAEQEAVAMVISINELEHYIESAPAIRLNRLTWAIIDNNNALLLGKPLLPLTAQVFWNRKDFIIPAGLDFELFILCDDLNNSINLDQNFLVVWNPDSTCFLVKKTAMRPLSISSFRLSIQQIQTTN